MGKSGKGNGPTVKKLSVQKQLELKSLIQRLLTIDIDRKVNNNQEWDEYLELKSVVDQIQSIEVDSKLRTGGNESRIKHVPAFMKWVSDNGGIVQNIEICDFPGLGLGLKATKDFTKDDVMITIPSKLFMSLDNPVLLTEPYLTEIPFPPTINVKLAFWLIAEKLNPNSFYRPYIDILPEKIPNFMQYSTAEMQELKGSCGLPYAINQFKKFLRSYAVMYRFLEQSTHPSLEHVRHRLTFDLYW